VVSSGQIINVYKEQKRDKNPSIYYNTAFCQQGGYAPKKQCQDPGSIAAVLTQVVDVEPYQMQFLKLKNTAPTSFVLSSCQL